MKTVIIDNYDSFTYNLAHLVKELGAETDVLRNDKFRLEELEPYDKIILSPGPGVPEEAGLLLDVIRTYAGRKPILGVCLGEQAIGQAFGGKLVNLEEKANAYPAQLSGGQKQRLSIARAIAKHPDVYIFDDSFSALDYKTDATLRAELKEKTAESTVMIVAQRISTILHADQIIVLEDGQIVGKGTHKELLKNCEAYYQIASSQLSEKELEEDLKEVE